MIFINAFYYDEAFKTGSYMNYGRVDFDVDDTTYALWAWKGDYWNLRSGAEVGLYIQNSAFSDTEHYDAVDFEVPMTLSLYNYHNKDNIENLFNWVPVEDQWWITGFDPSSKNPDPSIMVSVASVDLSEHTELFDAISNPYSSEYYYDLKKEHIIFDTTTKTVWIQWYNVGVA